VHFHDTYGQAIANIATCLEAVRVVDSAVSGAGGCPYAKGASGNVASEDVVYLLQGLGLDSGVDLPALAETGRWLAGLLGRATASRTGRRSRRRLRPRCPLPRAAQRTTATVAASVRIGGSRTCRTVQCSCLPYVP
jgi:hypothetical protein